MLQYGIFYIQNQTLSTLGSKIYFLGVKFMELSFVIFMSFFFFFFEESMLRLRTIRDEFMV